MLWPLTVGVSEAARQVFVTQPTITESIRLLEEKLRIAIFNRTSRGVSVTQEGEEFLASARQILDDSERILEKYTGKAVRRPQFAVSCQHYAFAVDAFKELFTARPHVFLGRRHPLAKHKIVKPHELDGYPYLTYEQGLANALYFSEEIMPSLDRQKEKHPSPR